MSGTTTSGRPSAPPTWCRPPAASHTRRRSPPAPRAISHTTSLKTLSGSPNTYAIIMQDGMKGMEMHFDAHALDNEDDLALVVAMALETWKKEREKERHAGH